MPGKTLRNLRLKPGAAFLKKTLNNRRPKIVSARNFFPDVSTQRPVINTGSHLVTPTQVSTESLFPGPKKPSAFNLSPNVLRLRKKQENAIKAAEGKEVLAFPMNNSQGGESGGRRKTRRKSSRRHK